MKEINRIELGETLRQLRELQCLSLKDIAKAMNVTISAVSQWESKGQIKTEKLYEISKFYNKNIEDIISGHIFKDDAFEITDDLFVFSKPDFRDIKNVEIGKIIMFMHEFCQVIEYFNNNLEAFVHHKLDSKNNEMFLKTFKLIKLDYEYCEAYYSSTSIQLVLEEIVEKYSGEEREYELSKALEYNFGFDLIDYLDLENGSLMRKLCKILPLYRRSLLLTEYYNYLLKSDYVLESSTSFKELVKSGASIVYERSDFWRKSNNELILDYIEGDIIENKEMMEALNYIALDEDGSSLSDTCYHVKRSWKSVPYKDSKKLIKTELTEQIKCLIFQNARKALELEINEPSN